MLKFHFSFHCASLPAGIPLLCPLCFLCPRLLPKNSKNDEKDFPRSRDKPIVPNSFREKPDGEYSTAKMFITLKSRSRRRYFPLACIHLLFLLNHIYRNQQSVPPFIFDLPTIATPPNSHDHHHPNTTASACYHR